MIKAVIFDLDGTLIDTEKYYRINWPKAFEHFGYKMTDQQYLSLRSLGKPFVQELLKQYSGDKNFDYAKVVAYRSELMEHTISEHGLQAKPGAAELLQFLAQKNIERAVATASPVERAQRYLSQVGLISYFDKIISARNMNQGKPAPDVYTFACKELSLLPEECLAVEDSPNGVLSAYRAGCKVVMVPEFTQPDQELKNMLYAKKETLKQIIDLFQ